MLRITVSLLALFMTGAPIATGAPLAGSRPNIILVMTDDQGYGPMGAHGHPWIRTPHLDRLHGEATRFERFLVSPTCSPTRSALMSGRHPLKNGVTHTILERERMALQTTTIAQVLQSAGYATGIFGKWHLGDEEPYQPENRGFNEVFIHGAGGIGQAYDCSCADAPGNKYFNPVIRHNGSFVKTDGYCTDLFFTAGMGWIRQAARSGAPFFAYIVTNAPHGPFIAPPENEKRFTDLGFSRQTAGFYGMIENIDANMGRLLARLEEWQLDRNTLVIFMSDNGMTGGGSGEPGKELADGHPFYNAGMKGLKGSADEGGVRVPFLVRWPGRVTAGASVDRIAAHIDVFPTLAALAGVQAAKFPAGQVDGRSLLPLLENPQGENWADRYLFTQRARWPTGADPDDHQWEHFAVRNQRFRLVGNALFDMQGDPGQTKDVAAEHPAQVAAMRAAYEAFWREARPLMVNEGAPMSPTRPFHVWFAEQEQRGGIPAWDAPEL